MTISTVLVVGAGISGLACARVLHQAGVDVRVVDRGREPGGRMAIRTLHGRAVDFGASYFTAEPDTGFDVLVQDWVSRGLAREWTDTFSTSGADGIGEAKSGPMRYGSPTGLRDLVIDLGIGLPVEQQRQVDSVSADREVAGIRFDAVVLAMPDPQAGWILDSAAAAFPRLQSEGAWEPTIAVALGFEDRRWPVDMHGTFVHDDPSVAFIADDGDRRGDGAPVLVAHSTPELARRFLDEPDAAIPAVVSAVSTSLGLDAPPSWTQAFRWTFARPAETHGDPFVLENGIGLCGDAWGAKSSVGTAWASGDALGRAIVAT